MKGDKVKVEEAFNKLHELGETFKLLGLEEVGKLLISITDESPYILSYLSDWEVEEITEEEFQEVNKKGQDEAQVKPDLEGIV